MGKRISKAPAAANTPKPLLPLDDSGRSPSSTGTSARSRRTARREIYIVGSTVTFGTQLAAMDEDPGDVDHERLPRRPVGQRPLDPPRVHEQARHPRRHVARRPDGRRRRLRSVALRRSREARRGRARRRSCAASSARPTKRSWSSATTRRRPARPRQGPPRHAARPRACAASARRRASSSSSPSDHALWLAAAAWCMQFSTAKTRSEHEDITQRLMIARALDVVVVRRRRALHGVRHARRVRRRASRDGPALAPAPPGVRS